MPDPVTSKQCMCQGLKGPDSNFTARELDSWTVSDRIEAKKKGLWEKEHFFITWGSVISSVLRSRLPGIWIGY